MKKVIISLVSIIITIGAIVVVLGSFPEVKVYGQTSSNELVEEINTKLIRFHVIANSDSDEDQKLKLKVRDEIIKYIAPKLKESKSIEESREILKDNNDKIIEIAKECIKKNGYDYNVQTTLGRENFPVKTYGNITLPQGNYEAYRVLIGKASGQNWWCVMFPPLCFVDITKGQVAYKETEKQMKEVLTEEEYEKIDNTKATNASTSPKKAEVKFKFKVVEILDKALKNIDDNENP